MSHAQQPEVHQTRSGQTTHELYRHLDEEINRRLGATVGFTALIRPTPYPMDAEFLAGFQARYALIKRFQDQTLALFKASLRGDADPEIAGMVVGDLPGELGLAYHQQLTDAQHRSPVFFRTDEVAPGKVVEIQCPGSGWGLAEEIRTLYCNHESTFGPPVYFHDSLAAEFANALRSYVGSEPIVHHLSDNASRPHGVRYFLQRVREQGINHFSYDRGITPEDCNFVRSHDFVSIPYHNFFSDRMRRCNHGNVFFDLSPSGLFDGKMILAWPFWEKTRQAYDDEVRAILPYTNLIRPDGIELAHGQQVSLADFCDVPQRKRNYYVKYAGTDITQNWGSKSVFLTSTLSGIKCRELMQRIVKDSQRQRYWIVQEAIRCEEQVSALARDGEPVDVAAYSKFSGFYGPNGLMAVCVMQRRSHKVHGNPNTIMSLVF